MKTKKLYDSDLNFFANEQAYHFKITRVGDDFYWRKGQGDYSWRGPYANFPSCMAAAMPAPSRKLVPRKKGGQS